MDAMAANMGQRAIENAFESTKAQITAPRSSIDWNDFNWPPFLNLAHFKLSELKDPHLLPCRRQYALFFLVCFHFLYNLFNVIVQVAHGYSGLRILACFLIMSVLVAIAGFANYTMYRGICQDNSLLLRYKIATGLLLAIHLPMWIADTINFNGIMRAVEEMEHEHAFLGVLCIIEVIFVIALDALLVLQLIAIFKWKGALVNY